MTAQRIAGVTALVSGLLLVLAIGASTVAGTSTSAGGWTTIPGIGPGMRGVGPMGPGAADMGPGMAGMPGMGPGMMGFANTGPAATAIPGAPEVRVVAANFGFAPSEIHLPRNADVNLTFANPTSVAHDFTVPGLGIHVVAGAGEARSVALRGLAAGRYDAFCSVPGHADLGMRATLVFD